MSPIYGCGRAGCSGYHPAVATFPRESADSSGSRVSPIIAGEGVDLHSFVSGGGRTAPEPRAARADTKVGPSRSWPRAPPFWEPPAALRRSPTSSALHIAHAWSSSTGRIVRLAHPFVRPRSAPGPRSRDIFSGGAPRHPLASLNLHPPASSAPLRIPTLVSACRPSTILSHTHCSGCQAYMNFGPWEQYGPCLHMLTMLHTFGSWRLVVILLCWKMGGANLLTMGGCLLPSAVGAGMPFVGGISVTPVGHLSLGCLDGGC